MSWTDEVAEREDKEENEVVLEEVPLLSASLSFFSFSFLSFLSFFSCSFFSFFSGSFFLKMPEEFVLAREPE
jgi:hypothetical protein